MTWQEEKNKCQQSPAYLFVCMCSTGTQTWVFSSEVLLFAFLATIILFLSSIKGKKKKGVSMERAPKNIREENKEY